MKKLLFLVSVIIIILTISLKVNYKSHITLSFGNNIKGTYNYLYKQTRINDITNDIKNNIKIKDKYIQNLLVKSEQIYFDFNDLDVNKNNIYDIEQLIQLIRNYTKEKIMIVIREERNSDDKIINKWIFKIKDKYDIMIKR